MSCGIMWGENEGIIRNIDAKTCPRDGFMLVMLKIHENNFKIRVNLRPHILSTPPTVLSKTNSRRKESSVRNLIHMMQMQTTAVTFDHLIRRQNKSCSDVLTLTLTLTTSRSSFGMLSSRCHLLSQHKSPLLFNRTSFPSRFFNSAAGMQLGWTHSQQQDV